MLSLFVRLRLTAERVARRAMGAPEMRTPGGHDTTSSFMGYTILRSTQFDYLVVLSVMIIQIEKTRQASWLANLSGLVVDSLVVSHWLTCAAKDFVLTLESFSAMPCARTHSRGNCYCAMNISRAGVLYPDWLCTLPVTSSLYVANC